MNYSDPAVVAAMIQSGGAIVAAVIAAICAAIIGKQFADRKRLQEELVLAQGDIAFLLGVEAEHCEMHKAISKQSFKHRVRTKVSERGLNWSGKFTPGRVKSQLDPKGAKVFALVKHSENIAAS